MNYENYKFVQIKGLKAFNNRFYLFDLKDYY